MTISMIIHVSKEVLTTGQLILLDNKTSTRNGIYPVDINKLILGTKIEMLDFRQARVSSTKDSSVTLE